MSAMNNLARTYNHLGIYKEAEKLAVVVLAHQSKFLNKNGQTHTLHALNNLALTYRHLGHLKAAKMLEVVVLKMKKTTVSLWPI
ncbi:hypothetical protein DFH09DRAFT_234509 [Mycena vulgaris]|nr:hypothetical protein DFH09DRAFT_234509 [Mycena vulgaris]